MICKIGTKLSILAALTCKLATVNPPCIFPFRTQFYTVQQLPVMTALPPRGDIDLRWLF
jgi:hypothetical protein